MGLPLVGKGHQRQTDSPEGANRNAGAVSQRIESTGGGRRSAFNHQPSTPEERATPRERECPLGALFHRRTASQGNFYSRRHVNAVVYRAVDNHIHEIFLPLGGHWSTGDLSSQSGAPPAAGDPATYRRSDNVNSVLYRGLDNDINELYLPLGGSWNIGNLSDRTGAPPANRSM